MTAQEYLLKFKIQVDGTLPGVNPVQVNDNAIGPFDSGTGGPIKIPGSAGAPVMVMAHGGEYMDIANPARGQSLGGGGGGGIFIENLTVLDGTDFQSTLASMQENASRNAQNVAAGAEYTG